MTTHPTPAHPDSPRPARLAGQYDQKAVERLLASVDEWLAFRSNDCPGTAELAAALRSCEAERKEAVRLAKVWEDIKIAEKKILLQEIERRAAAESSNAALRAEVEELRKTRDEMIPALLYLRVYHKAVEYPGYLKARFPNIPGCSDGSFSSFEFSGHRWRYCYTDFDDAGEFDLLERPNPAAIDQARERRGTT